MCLHHWPCSQLRYSRAPWKGKFVKMCTKQHMSLHMRAQSMAPAQEREGLSHVAPSMLHPQGWAGRVGGACSHVGLEQLWPRVLPRVPQDWGGLLTPAPSPLACSPVPRNINQRSINRWSHEKYIMISRIDPKCLFSKLQQAAQVFTAAVVSHLICVSVPLSLDVGKIIFPWFSLRSCSKDILYQCLIRPFCDWYCTVNWFSLNRKSLRIFSPGLLPFPSKASKVVCFVNESWMPLARWH